MLAKRLQKTGKVNLGDFSTSDTGGLTKEDGEARFVLLARELEDLQELLYAAGENSLLVVLQGRDTSGKDGTLTAVAGAMNPVGVRVASFKVPTSEELAHDFLWRIHKQTPEKGQVVFFNRSQYEDVLVARVHELVPQSVWERRFDHINRFEEMLSDAGTLIVKLYLHLSESEQEERLLAREEDPEKAWKLNPGDWSERKRWDAYTAAYEDALGRCATPHAPWYIVPSDRKWFRNLAVAESLVTVLEPYRTSWEKKLMKIGENQKAALAKMRQEESAKKPGKG
ncbi:MAG: polyphosphate kinase 2 family protein [Cytophagales bacterium]|nr:polyphosphate kinase 2 family protein [Armatimonadota bacterium]